MTNKFENLTVDKFTTPCPHTLSPQDSITAAMNIMKEKQIRHIPIVDGTTTIGIVSDRDLALLPFMGQDIKVDEVMSKDIFQVDESSLLENVALDMSKRKIGSAIVNTHNGELLGIFTSTDALNALVEVIRGEILE